MMSLIKDRTYYTYNDVTIVPCVKSDVEHRVECNPFDENNHLPLFTAPMDSVVGKSNYGLFEENGIYAILPRTESLDDRIEYATNGKWAAFSLDEFEHVFCNKDKDIYIGKPMMVLIDVANGHMRKIFELAKVSKDIWGDKIMLMGGNIANPETYEEYAKCGFYGVRVGIGGGRGCLSSSNLGVHMPMASLIADTAEVKKRLLLSQDDDGKYTWSDERLPKIIADGGIRNYSDIIKALGLGADYVMVGSVFAKMMESAAVKTMDKACGSQKTIKLRFPYERYENLRRENGCWVGDYTDEFVAKMKDNGHENVQKEDHSIGQVYAMFYGMASREGQIAMNGAKTKTSEGLKANLEVEYTMSGWCRNFTDYLRSAMSYVGVKELSFFSFLATLIVNSENAIKAVNK